MSTITSVFSTAPSDHPALTFSGPNVFPTTSSTIVAARATTSPLMSTWDANISSSGVGYVPISDKDAIIFTSKLPMQTWEFYFGVIAMDQVGVALLVVSVPVSLGSTETTPSSYAVDGSWRTRTLGSAVMQVLFSPSKADSANPISKVTFHSNIGITSIVVAAINLGVQMILTSNLSPPST